MESQLRIVKSVEKTQQYQSDTVVVLKYPKAHPERSEGSRCDCHEILRFAQDGNPLPDGTETGGIE
jgi:hypothetical protein